jgi:HD-GYP domain-containing protein (c-di-GMP phosphodiesterase class II)
MRPDIASPFDPVSEALLERSRARLSAPPAVLERRSAIVAAAGFALTAAAMAIGLGWHAAPGRVALLVAVYAAATQVEFEVGAGSAVPTQLAFVPMLFLLPPGLVPAAVAAGIVVAYLVGCLRGDGHPSRALLGLGGSWHAVGPALVFAAAGRPVAGLAAGPVLCAALVAQFGADYASSAWRDRIVDGVPWGLSLRVMAWVYLVDGMLAPVGLLAAMAAARTSAGAVLLVAPLCGLLAVFARERRHRIDHALELSRAYRGTAMLLGDVVEADDAYTGSHSRDVVELVLAVADRLGLSARERQLAEFTALLHDVGKIRIPAEIINKPGRLDPAERALIETHTVEGERILSQVGGVLAEVGRLVRSCHEHWDGGGYPDRLAGPAIPLVARIVAACDAVNAMTTDRSYRAAMPAAEALAELRRCAGTQFDPVVAEALAAVVNRHGPVRRALLDAA